MPGKIRGKEAVDLGVRHQVRQSGEAALGLQRLCGAHEAGPRRQCQRAADADASHAERRDLVHTQANVPNDEKVEWPWRNRRDERLDLCRRLWTRREEHVCACCDVRLQTSDALAEGIWMAHVVALCSCGQQHVLA